MADVAEDQLDDFADASLDGNDAPAEAGPKAPAPGAAPPSGGSFLSKLLGGKKKLQATNATTAPEAPAPMPVPAPAPPQQKNAAGTGAPAAKMPPGALVTIMTRNDFYRDGFRRLLWIAFLEAGIIVAILVAFIAFITTGKSQDRYFATTADGRIMQLAPLDQPGTMSTAALMSWVALATSEVMTFSYNDYQRKLQLSSRHFTHHGWETFTSALQASHIIDGMLTNKEVLTASPHNAPILIQEGVINGKYRWIVKLQLQVSYEGGATAVARKSNMNVTLVIERVPSLENPSGVGIEQWIATQG